MARLAAFKKKWGRPSETISPVDVAELGRVGQKLGFIFPQDYITAMGEVGPLSTTLGLLDVITSRRANLHDLSALHAPDDVLSSTINWRQAGMPSWLVAIGSDCGGSSFCFDTRRKGLLRQPSSAIYFWDHDLGGTSKVASSFDEWIESYLSLPGNYDSWKNADN